jgi:hypothetical protein
MMHLPFRTNRTWLTDDQLILLDVLFDVAVSFKRLRAEDFGERWNVRYSHQLDDAQLQCALRWLCEHGVLEIERDADGTAFHRMTAAGGALWSEERCPVWERYCTERYKTTSRGRTLMTVTAVSAEVRDHFLSLWSPNHGRRRAVTISDGGLIRWHSFGQLFVGVTTYEGKNPWEATWETPQEFAAWRERQAKIECERTWWRCVSELQRFVPNQAKT